MFRTLILIGWIVALAGIACSPPEKSATGFRLPDGDPEEGKAAFVTLRCNACHQVRGVELEPPVADPPVPVVLGGPVDYQPTDGRFVTSIVNPSHKLAPGYPAELIKSGDGSRMADYSEVMTVRQLVDLLAFLHTRYDYSPPSIH